MMLNPTIAQLLAAERQRDMLGRAGRDRQARTAHAARSARPATAERARPYLLRRAYTALARH